MKTLTHTLFDEVRFGGLATSGPDYWASKGALSLSIGAIPAAGALMPLSPPESIETTETTQSTETTDSTQSTQSTGTTGAVETALPEDYPAFPLIEFGLQTAGHLVFSHSFAIPSDMASASNTGNGAVSVHSTQQAVKNDCQSAAKTIFDAFIAATRQQAEGKGYFHQPFMVRYALRTTDDHHILPSAPILMMGNMLPPCLAVEGCETSDEQSIITLSNTSYPYFELRYRIKSLPDPKWASHIAAIDIFVSEPIKTYDPDVIAEGGVKHYSQIVQGCPLRKNNQNSNMGQLVAGIWSEANDCHQPHTLQSLGLDTAQAWDITPNNMLRSDIAAQGKFHKIASIPIGLAETTEGFRSLEIGCTSQQVLSALPMLEEDNLTHCRLEPAFATNIGGRVHAGGGSIQLPTPLPLDSLMVRHRPLSATGSMETIIKVWIKDKGQTCFKQSIAQSQTDLAEVFPPYIFYPHRDAYLMQITQNGQSWTVPLTPHSTLNGAFWMGDLASLTPPASCTSTLPEENEGSCFRNNYLYTSAIDNPLCFTTINIIGNGSLVGVAPALQAFSSGQWGQFPIYIFATDGVWALAATTDGGLKVRQQVCDSSCIVGENTVCQGDNSVFFATTKGVMKLSGSKCANISTDIANSRQEHNLPHLSDLLNGRDLSRTFMPATCSLQYDSVNRLLWCNDGEWHWAYSVTGEKWGQWIDACDKMLILSRPIRFNAEGKARITSLEFIPPTPAKVEWILYGSDDLEHWQIAASGQKRHSGLIMGTPFRFHLIAIAASRQPLNGLNVTFNIPD